MEREDAAVTILQAHARGLLVRRRVQRVLRDYEAVVRDIEGENVAVQWGKCLLSTPHIQPRVHRSEAAVLCRKGGDKSKSGQLSINEHFVPANDDLNGVQSQFSLQKTSEKCEQSLSESDLPEKINIFLSETNTPATEDPLPVTFDTKTSDPGEVETNMNKDTPIQPDHPEMEDIIPRKDSMLKNALGLYTDQPDQRFDSFDWTRDSSVWSDKSPDTDLSSNNINDLQKLRSHLAMEILWVQQAISSRKNYLMVRRHLGMMKD